MSDTNAEADSTKESPIHTSINPPSPVKSQSPANAEIAEMLAQEAGASYFDKKRRLCPSPISQSGTPSLESKKRRKQATPIRVSNLFEFEAKELTDQVSNGDKAEQAEKIEQKEPPQSPEQERGLMPRDRDDWFPVLPFNLFPDSSQFLHKSQFLSKNGFLPFLPGLPSSPPVRIFNPEAYCNLCHKEFCNKYFLKTHKANKHGIYENNADSQAFSAAIRPMKPDSLETSNHFSTKCSAPSEEGSVTSPTGERSSELACTMCPRRFPKAFFLRRHILEEHGDISPPVEEQQPPPPPPPLPQLPQLPATTNSADASDQRQASFPRKLSPESCRMARSAGFAPDYLKKLGILDPEAFCEICCKEYCNKYFLRTHKLKRHGILLSDDSYGAIKEENSRSGSQSQTSPLNLIMDARPKQEPPSTSENETFGESELASHESDSPVSSNSQDLCKDLQKLQTMILQLNNLQNKDTGAIRDGRLKEESNGFATHTPLPNMQQERDDNCGNTEAGENKEEGEPFSDFKRTDLFMQNYENFRKTPDKQPLNATTPVVTPNLSQKNFNIMNSFCEICNKQLCNKYFMKTHMEKMHGIQINNEFKIGGVICDICQKELCSKYFLKVHKQNTHGIFEDGVSGAGLNQSPSMFPGSLGLPAPPQFTPPEQMAQYQPALTEAPEPVKEPERAPDKERRAEEGSNSQDQDTDMCPLCGRRFRGSKWLRSHLVNDHGTEPRDADPLQTSVATNIFDGGPSKVYRCNFCDFSSPILALLFVHERSHVSTPAPAPAAASEPANADVKRFLRDVARRHNLVSSYALPEPRGPETRYEMQPFVIEQFCPDSEDPERTILPAVIYLPVAEKIHSKLSVTFSLTPI